MHASNATFDMPAASSVVRRLIITLLSGLVVLYSNVAVSMFTSSRTYTLALYPSLALYAVFIGMWVYTSTYLQKKDIRWFETHERFLYTATATMVAASVLWVIGMWGEYGFWTIPLYMVIATFVMHAIGLIPRVHTKTE